MKGSEVQNHTKAEGEREWAHPLDLSETKDDFVVKVELPGMDAKDINISLTGEEKEEDYHLVERSYGAFSRSVRLPPRWKAARLWLRIRMEY